MKYTLKENAINGIKINDKIRDEELFEYYIVNRSDFIDDLITWIAEAKTPDRSSDNGLMKDDLKMLIILEDEYIFNSISTNDYIYESDDRFENTCEELLELNNSLS